ncbi:MULTISPECIES: MinD/ParA family protein [Planococcaceae]|uniref:Cobyrinic acid a,c-diamide synthase n=1 Tax=Planococcus halotolerans TaxID=2233542 RepID=A0A365KQT0_9BACL|nr:MULTISPECIES: MinD/ParA family protein [Planococcaceae]QHJ69551.1 P-loop NTPase [Planococcus halotolerans]RAZ75501.1 cobyrinic acid a,c-diamide synthase [Planococcus halotolerans]RLQ90985.1 MinD/ParA family protein [Planomicrobium sp. Y74]
MIDQAKQLREKMMQKKPKKERKQTRIIAVTSGKGGVGKSNFALNFALSLVEQNRKVLIFDVDLGFANVDVLLGRSPEESIATMVEKDLSIWDIIEEGPNGLLFISGGTGFNEMFKLDEAKMKKFFDELSEIQGHVDYVILDTGAGLSDENLRFILAADDVILVTTPEPTSITDAYSIVKMVHVKDPNVHMKLIVNQCTTEKEGKQTADNFRQVTQQFLEKEIGTLGYIPSDSNIPAAVKKQVPFLLAFPNTYASQAMRKVTGEFLDLPVPYKLGIKGFLLKMLFK